MRRCTLATFCIAGRVAFFATWPAIADEVPFADRPQLNSLAMGRAPSPSIAAVLTRPRGQASQSQLDPDGNGNLRFVRKREIGPLVTYDGYLRDGSSARNLPSPGANRFSSQSRRRLHVRHRCSRAGRAK